MTAPRRGRVAAALASALASALAPMLAPVLAITALGTLGATLAGCHRADAGASSATFPSLPDAGVGAALPQRFEIRVDGRATTLSPDATGPHGARAVSATVSQGGGVLALSVDAPGLGLAFRLGVVADRIEAGRYEAGDCPAGSRCTRRGLGASLGLGAGDGAAGRLATTSAWDAPPLGLSPAVLTIESSEDTVWPGVGPARRVRGTFAGDFTALERDADGRDHVAGPIHHVTGRFDLYAALR